MCCRPMINMGLLIVGVMREREKNNASLVCADLNSIAFQLIL